MSAAILDLIRKRQGAARVRGDRVQLHTKGARVLAGRIDEQAMSAAFIISTPAEDRQGEVVLSKGCVATLATYRANPVVHLNHRTQEHPVALSKDYHGAPGVDVFDDRVEGVAHFHGTTELSAQTWELTRLGVYVAASVGFRPLLAERQAIEDGGTDFAPPDLIDFDRKSYRIVFRRWELVEWSVTGIPANQDAVVPLDYRELVTRTLSTGTLDGGRAILPEIRADLAPHALPRRLWRAVPGGLVVKGGGLVETPEDDHEPEDVDGGPSDAPVQAVLVPKATHPQLEGAAAAVRIFGHDATDAEDAGDWWSFSQFEPSACATGVTREMRGGCLLVRCRSGCATPTCPCGGGKGSVGANQSGAKAMRKQEDDREDDREDEDEGGNDKPSESIEKKAALKAGALWLRGLRAYCKACSDSVEESNVLKTAGRCVRLGARCARKVYKDQFKDMDYDDEDDGGGGDNGNGNGDDDEEEDAPKGKGKGLSDQEQAVLDAFEKAMQEFTQSADRFGRTLYRATGR